jgi:hypothetical protein
VRQWWGRKVAWTGERLCGGWARSLAGAKVYAVDVLGETSTLDVAIWVVAGDGGLERAAPRDVKVRVCHERRSSGLHVQLAAKLVVLAQELRVFLFELADAQRRWRQCRNLFRRERERRLELGHGLLELCICAHMHVDTRKKKERVHGEYRDVGQPYRATVSMHLLNVSLSFCAMPCLGLCIATPLGAVGVGSGLGIGCHGVRDAKNRRRGDKVCMTEGGSNGRRL